METMRPLFNKRSSAVIKLAEILADNYSVVGYPDRVSHISYLQCGRDMVPYYKTLCGRKLFVGSITNRGRITIDADRPYCITCERALLKAQR